MKKQNKKVGARMLACLIVLCVTAFAVFSCGPVEKIIDATNGKTEVSTEKPVQTETETEAETKTETETETKTETKTETETETETEVEAPVKEEQDEASLAALRAEIKAADCDYGIAYLGTNEGSFTDIKRYVYDLGMTTEYPFIQNITIKDFYKSAGDEVWLVVPADRKTSVKIYSGKMDENELVKDKLIGEPDAGVPFIVVGNVSETYPNIILDFGRFEHFISLSGMDSHYDGIWDNVYDFSMYDAIYEYFDTPSYGQADGADYIFCGQWGGYTENGCYEEMTMFLNIRNDGYAEYICGYGNSEIAGIFEGSWSCNERGMIILDLTGGPTIGFDGSEYDENNVMTLKSGFYWDIDYSGDIPVLELTHEEGDPIIIGKNGVTFELENYDWLLESEEDATSLIGTWGVTDDDMTTYLEIFDDGSAAIQVDENGDSILRVIGSWQVAGADILDLDIKDESMGYSFSGSYTYEIGSGVLRIDLVSGDPLTDRMAEQNYEEFFLYGIG